jgi:hypothetical protein
MFGPSLGLQRARLEGLGWPKMASWGELILFRRRGYSLYSNTLPLCQNKITNNNVIKNNRLEDHRRHGKDHLDRSVFRRNSAQRFAEINFGV